MTNLKLEDIKENIKRRQIASQIFAIVGLLLIFFALFTLLALTVKMFIDGLPRLSWKFFTSFPSRRAEEAGILSAWVGTAVVMLMTAVFAIPIGVASGIYLEEYGKKGWLAALIEVNISNLAGVPSIIYGLLALGLFVQDWNLGESILTAGLTLSLLILPVIVVATREAIKAIPNSLREAAYALGASKWQVIWDHLLPYSLGSILTGIIVALSRAIGETAPLITIGALTFIAFLPDPPFKSEFPYISFAWLKAPFTVMPIQMFNWVSRPQAAFQANAAAAGAVLVVMTLLMNGVAIYLRYRLRKGLKW
ncbi:MAG: phosphate ABC transporter permease PstA [Geminocystis sp.]|nr:phosphate ABC transporter permease PstA [Geminocystis sp.]HIK37836.1 phosphate ABC transporter permease PstA [Geminocystis sp. M7585_C2015_104]MCS7146936.1 phosphate ABC transporter permease PstA [Geminocystis sp.]MCX8077248.1 phosphate ABC transporter permease PstA [Geminocystis sp.]MDW8115760.1 phosphate ABC transporter permease PstA [Geminocystis sp.]